MSSAKTTKRPRRSSPDSDDVDKSEPESFKHHCSLWYDDGNIIIVASTIAFKLHASILSRESSVLGDVLNGPAAKLGYQDCPVYRLLDDLDDVTELLNALYGLNREYPQVQQLSFATVSSLFRMGTKYQVRRLQEEAVARLSACYPSSLDAYDHRLGAHNGQRPITWSKGQDCAVAMLALQNVDALHEVLPAALYECCLWSPMNLQFQALAAVQSGHDSYATLVGQSRFWTKLYTGRSRLVESRDRDTLCFLDKQLSDCCTSPKSCRSAVKSMAKAFRQSPLIDNPEALEFLHFMIDDEARKCCQPCIGYFKRRHEGGRDRVWGKLREYFDVPVPAAAEDGA